jgi:protein-S-isoprenylcysteine O-methyltransferase Ste14
VYGFAGVVIPYMLLFSGGTVVPKHVDSGAQVTALFALLFDAGLVLLFALQHSVMARAGFKRWLTQFVPESLERATYVLATCIVLVVVFVLWKPVTVVVWSVSGIGRGLIEFIYWMGVVYVYVSAFWLDHTALLGLRQAIRAEAEDPEPLCTTGPYRLSRHPIMLGLLIVFWAEPNMTLGHLFLALLLTVYMYAGTSLEERDMVKKFGRQYAEYQRGTPRFLPTWTTIDSGVEANSPRADRGAEDQE